MAASAACLRTRARGAIQRCQLVGEGEKNRKSGAFWCILVHDLCNSIRRYTAYGVRRAVWKDVLRKKNAGSDAFDAFNRCSTPRVRTAYFIRGRADARSNAHFVRGSLGCNIRRNAENVAFCCIAVEMGNAAGVRNDFLRGQDQGTSTLPPPFPAWRRRHHMDGRRFRPGLRSARPTALGRFPDRSRPARRTSAHRWWRHRRTGACWWSYI